LASRPPSPVPLSIVITVRNEERHLGRLLDSLLEQEPPYEVIVVDALSHDRTAEIAASFVAAHPDRFRFYERYGSRGIGRNLGVEHARFPYVAFIDGDCAAGTGWLHALRAGLARSDVVAGTTTSLGNPTYGHLGRVELYLADNDVTYPSCNLAYRTQLFRALGGFDPRFITAEDIDLNLRAVGRGAQILHVPEAVVYHQARRSLLRFLVQAFWNGYGRKQLTEKHGSLWARYRYRRLLSGQRSLISWARLVAAIAGYLTRVLTGGARRLTAPTLPAGGGPTAEAEQRPGRPSA
jgi:glycosyltransferase AglI